jgi:hypothetical protein
MGFAAAQPILLRLFDPYARLVAVDELDAGFFERVLNGFDGARLQVFAGLEPTNCIGRDLGHGREFADADLQGGPRHPALLGINRHKSLISD